jgi:hypothetical protein
MTVWSGANREIELSSLHFVQKTDESLSIGFSGPWLTAAAVK